MSVRTSPWPPGMPCWIDLSSPDVEAAKRFYSEALGWTYLETGDEALAQVHGVAAASIRPQQPGEDAGWTLYLASDDADATAGAITKHGGSVVLAPSDVGSLGRMLLATEPTGAPFGVWQAKDHIGAGVVNEPGGLIWEDLRSPDPDSARSFYSAIFGYRIDLMPEAAPDYATFSMPGEENPLGGMGPMMGAEGPAHWLVYLGVAETAAAVAAAVGGGGYVVQPELETPYGRMAGLTDPGGALFWVSQTEGQDVPGRSG